MLAELTKINQSDTHILNCFHLVSDATGETVWAIARAVLSFFPDIKPDLVPWSLIRGPDQLKRVIEAIRRRPGFVLCTLADEKQHSLLKAGCHQLGIPCLSPLTPIIKDLAHHIKGVIPVSMSPGKQHVMDAEYYSRIAAIDFAVKHDDGGGVANLEEADIVLVGVSRTSKTPTCLYLAHRGLKAANVPLVKDVDPPRELLTICNPLVIGLIVETSRLVRIRSARLHHSYNGLERAFLDPYTDRNRVYDEINMAQRLFTKQKWPVIDVTHRSVEEVAAIAFNYHRDLINARSSPP